MPKKTKPVKGRMHICGAWPSCTLPCPAFEPSQHRSLRWRQFEQPVLTHLRAAREALALVSGMALSDGMSKWSGEAHELATRVQVLVNEIEENAQRVLQKSCR